MDSALILSLKKQKNFYGSKIKILSPAKINLYLNIIGKREGGFHRVESVVERISLADKIIIEVKERPQIKISSNIKSLQTSGNLCCKAARLLKEKYRIPLGFHITLKKNIPVASGLGGGSSNAASVLLGINKLLNLKLTKEQLYRLGAKLGSDVNFFLSLSSFAFLEGRGEKITPFNVKKSFSHFIIWPGISASTKKVYNNFKAKLTKNFNNVNILKYALSKGDIPLLKKSIFNILEKEACSVYGGLRKAKEILDKKNIFSKMSGSGSSFYTVDSDISLRKIKSVLPQGWTVFKAETF